jgi:hypothetical protein
LVADAQIPLAVAAREAPGHQATDAAAPQGPTAPGLIDGQPLAMLRQGLLHGIQGRPRLHSDREVAGVVLQDAIEGAAADHRAG